MTDSSISALENVPCAIGRRKRCRDSIGKEKMTRQSFDNPTHDLGPAGVGNAAGRLTASGLEGRKPSPGGLSNAPKQGCETVVPSALALLGR